MRSLFLFAAACLALTAVAADEKKIVCYFGSWSVYRPGAGKFEIEDIDPKLCTHAIYTFVGLDKNRVTVLDTWQDLATDGGKDGFRRFNALRNKNPNLKTLVAIGGWNEGSTKYSAMAADSTTRKIFVDTVYNFVKEHGFDGFDLDWEYPAQRGGSHDDVKNFILLIKELKARFAPEGLLLSAAVGAAKSSASQSYNIPEMSKNLDFINLMAYDLHGSWESTAGINAPLKAASSETGSQRDLNIEAVVKYWLDQGADPKKLILGTGTYGRSFTLADANNADVGAPTTGAGAAGPYTREPGMLGYNEICEDPEWEVSFDEERRVPFAHKGNQWVGFDDVKSIKEKADFVKTKGLGGAMVWSIETDDFKGNCGEKFALVKTLYHVLRGGPAVSETMVHKPRPKKPSVPKPNQPQRNNQHSNPNQNSSGECTKEGDLADPTTCKSFYKCVSNGDGTFRKETMLCPPGLCYKASSGVCDWE